MIFGKLFLLIAKTYPAQRSITFMFDEKDAIAENAVTIHTAAKQAADHQIGEDYFSNIAFGNDEQIVPLQAADLFAYEWRKRISDATITPDKRVRKSYERIRKARSGGALWRYGRSLFDEALTIDPVTGDQTVAYYNRFMERDPTHYD
jgi:hypothetical protein